MFGVLFLTSNLKTCIYEGQENNVAVNSARCMDKFNFLGPELRR